MKCSADVNACCTAHMGAAREGLFQLEGDDSRYFNASEFLSSTKLTKSFFMKATPVFGFKCCARQGEADLSFDESAAPRHRNSGSKYIIEKDAFGDDATHLVTCQIDLPLFIILTNGKIGEFQLAIMGSFKGALGFREVQVPASGIKKVVFRSYEQTDHLIGV